MIPGRTDISDSPVGLPIKKIKEEPEEIPELFGMPVNEMQPVKEEPVFESKPDSLVDPKYIQIVAPKDEVM